MEVLKHSPELYEKIKCNYVHYKTMHLVEMKDKKYQQHMLDWLEVAYMCFPPDYLIKLDKEAYENALLIGKE